MKKIQKKLSVVLAVMMVLCMFTALPFSASVLPKQAKKQVQATRSMLHQM